MKLLLAITTFLSLLLPAFSFGATYPASCPAEARGIVEAVGGCAAISCSQYEAICAKCCPSGSAPASASLTTFYIKPATANIRECAGLTCSVIGRLSQNTSMELPYGSLNELPEWVEYKFNDQTGYLNKTVISDRKSALLGSQSRIEPTTPPVEPVLPPTATPAPSLVGRAIASALIVTFFLAVLWKLGFKIMLYLVKKYGNPEVNARLEKIDEKVAQKKWTYFLYFFLIYLVLIWLSG